MATPSGAERALELGGLRFVVSRREFGGDGGPTVEVWGEVDGEDTQVLRFDCFRKAPHYHMPPSAPGVIALDPAEVGDGLDWTLDCVRHRLPEMVREAGFGALAGRLDAGALTRGADELRLLVDAL